MDFNLKKLCRQDPARPKPKSPERDTLNPTPWTFEICFQDNLPAAAEMCAGAATEGRSRIDALDLESVQKAFESDCLKLATDMASFADYVRKCGSSDRDHALAKVLKAKSEHRRGSEAVVSWMNRNCKFVANDYNEEHLNIVEARLVSRPQNLLPEAIRIEIPSVDPELFARRSGDLGRLEQVRLSTTATAG